MYFTSLLFNTFLKIHIQYIYKLIQKPLSINICLNRFSAAVENKFSDDIYGNYNQFSPDVLEKVWLDSHKIAFMTKLFVNFKICKL